MDVGVRGGRYRCIPSVEHSTQPALAATQSISANRTVRGTRRAERAERFASVSYRWLARVRCSSGARASGDLRIDTRIAYRAD